MKSIEGEVLLCLHKCLQSDEALRRSWTAKRASQAALRLHELCKNESLDILKTAATLLLRRQAICWALLVLGGRTDVQLLAVSELMELCATSEELSLMQRLAVELQQQCAGHPAGWAAATPSLLPGVSGSGAGAEWVPPDAAERGLARLNWLLERVRLRGAADCRELLVVAVTSHPSGLAYLLGLLRGPTVASPPGSPRSVGGGSVASYGAGAGSLAALAAKALAQLSAVHATHQDLHAAGATAALVQFLFTTTSAAAAASGNPSGGLPGPTSPPTAALATATATAASAAVVSLLEDLLTALGNLCAPPTSAPASAATPTLQASASAPPQGTAAVSPFTVSPFASAAAAAAAGVAGAFPSPPRAASLGSPVPLPSPSPLAPQLAFSLPQAGSGGSGVAAPGSSPSDLQASSSASAQSEAAGRELLRFSGGEGLQAVVSVLSGSVTAAAPGGGSSGGSSGGGGGLRSPSAAKAAAVRILAGMASHPSLRRGLVAAGAVAALATFVDRAGGPWQHLLPTSQPKQQQPQQQQQQRLAPGTIELALLALARCVRSAGRSGTSAAGSGGGGGSERGGSAGSGGSGGGGAGGGQRLAMAGPGVADGLPSPAVLQLLLDVVAVPPGLLCSLDGAGGGGGGVPESMVVVVVEVIETLADLCRDPPGALLVLGAQGHLMLLQRLLVCMPPTPAGHGAPSLSASSRRQLDGCLRTLARLALAAPSSPDLRAARTHEALLHALLAVGLAERPGWWALQGLCAMTVDFSCAADLVRLGILRPVVAALRGLAAAKSRAPGPASASASASASPHTIAIGRLGELLQGDGSGRRTLSSIPSHGSSSGASVASAASAGASAASVAAWHRDMEVAHLMGLLLQNTAAHKVLAKEAVAEGAVRATCEWLVVCVSHEDLEGALLCCATLCLLGDGDQGALLDMVHTDGIDALVQLMHPRWAYVTLVPTTVAAAIAVTCRWPASAQAVRMAGGIPALTDCLRGPHGLACCRAVVNAFVNLICNDPPALREIRTTNTIIALGMQLQLMPDNDPRAPHIRLLLKTLGEDPDTAMRLANSGAENALAANASASSSGTGAHHHHQGGHGGLAHGHAHHQYHQVDGHTNHSQRQPQYVHRYPSSHAHPHTGDRSQSTSNSNLQLHHAHVDAKSPSNQGAGDPPKPSSSSPAAARAGPAPESDGGYPLSGGDPPGDPPASTGRNHDPAAAAAASTPEPFLPSLRPQAQQLASPFQSASGGGQGDWQGQGTQYDSRVGPHCGTQGGPGCPPGRVSSPDGAGAGSGLSGDDGEGLRRTRVSSTGATVRESGDGSEGEGPDGEAAGGSRRPSHSGDLATYLLSSSKNESSYKSLRRVSLKQLAKRMDASDFSDVEDDLEDYIAALEAPSHDPASALGPSRGASFRQSLHSKSFSAAQQSRPQQLRGAGSRQPSHSGNKCPSQSEDTGNSSTRIAERVTAAAEQAAPSGLADAVAYIAPQMPPAFVDYAARLGQGEAAAGEGTAPAMPPEVSYDSQAVATSSSLSVKKGEAAAAAGLAANGDSTATTSRPESDLQGGPSDGLGGGDHTERDSDPVVPSTTSNGVAVVHPGTFPNAEGAADGIGGGLPVEELITGSYDDVGTSYLVRNHHDSGDGVTYFFDELDVSPTVPSAAPPAPREDFNGSPQQQGLATGSPQYQNSWNTLDNDLSPLEVPYQPRPCTSSPRQEEARGFEGRRRRNPVVQTLAAVNPLRLFGRRGKSDNDELVFWAET